MAVPQLALFPIKGVVEFAGNHVFHTDESRRVIGRVVDQALADIGGKMGAVVVGFDRPTGIGSVNVKSIEVSADGLDRSKILSRVVSVA